MQNTDHTHAKTYQSSHPGAGGKVSFPRLRWVLLVGACLVGGAWALLTWTLPDLFQLHRSSSSLSPAEALLAYFLALTPVIYTLGGIILVFLGWQTANDYGWWGLSSRLRAMLRSAEKRQRTGGQMGRVSRREASATNRQVPVGKQGGVGPGQIHVRSHAPGQEKATDVQRQRHVRRTTPDTLARRRKERLYANRSFKGPAHQDELAQLAPALASLPLRLGEERGGMVKESEQEEAFSPVSGADEQSGPLVGALLLAEIRGGERTSSVTDQAAVLQVQESEEGDLASNVSNLETEIRPPVSLYLLKELTIVVQNEQGVKRTVQLNRQAKETRRYIERELLIRIAAQKGQPVQRENILEDVFAYGLSETRYDTTRLTRQFNKMTQFLREDINREARQLGLPELLIIRWDQRTDTYRLLLDECRVVDLETIDQAFRLLQGVTGQRSLERDVQQACQEIIDTCLGRGDFLEDYIEAYVRDGGDDWVDVWVRDCYTEYRDKLFQALWYRAEYWRMKAEGAPGTSEAERMLQSNWYSSAAKLYSEYALRALTSFNDHSAMIFDLKVKQRIGNGERALRSALDMFTATGNTYEGNRVYTEFSDRMKDLTHGKWKPHPETEAAWKNVRAQTKAHRIHLGVTPHEMSEVEAKQFEADVEIPAANTPQAMPQAMRKSS